MMHRFRFALLAATALCITLPEPARADPISGAILSAVGAQAFLGTGTAFAVAQSALTFAIGMGLSLLSKALFSPKPKMGEPLAGAETFVQIGGDVPRSICVGTVMLKGQLVYHNSYDDNKIYTQVFVLSDWPSDSLVDVLVNGKSGGLTLEGDSGDYLSYKLNEFNNDCEIRFYKGDQIEANSSLINDSNPSGKWTDSSVLTNMTYAYVWWRHDPDRKYFDQGVPELSFIVKGARLYDWRKDSTNGGVGSHRWGTRSTYEYNDNPIVALYNYQRGFNYGTQRIMGMGTPAYDLLHDTYTAAANVCDETVTLAEGGTEKRYRCASILSADENVKHINVLETLLSTCAGYLYDYGGRYYAQAGAAQASVGTITDSDLVVGSPVTYAAKRSRAELINRVHGQYLDTEEYTEQSYGRQIDAGATTNDGEELGIKLDLMAVPSRFQAERIAKIRLRESRKQATATITVGFHLIHLQAGDWISWASARFGTKTWRIVERNVDANTKTITLNLTEIDTAVFSWTSADESVPISQPVGITFDPGITQPAGFNIASTTVVSGDVIIPALVFNWTPITDPTVTSVILEYKIQGADNTTRIADPSPSTGEHIIQGVLPSVVYEARASITTIPARQTTWTAWDSVLTDAQFVTETDLPPEYTAVPDQPGTISLTSIVEVQASGEVLGVLKADWADVTYASSYDVDIRLGSATTVPSVANPNFVDTSAWSLDAGASISGGKLNVSNGYDFAWQTTGLTVGKTYNYTIKWTPTAGANLRFRNALAGTVVIGPVSVGTLGVQKTITGTFVAIGTGLTIEADGATYSGTVDQVLVTESLVFGSWVSFSAGASNYEWRGIRPGTVAEVKVRAVNGVGVESIDSATASHTLALNTVPPAAPSGLAASAAFQNVFLTWTNPADSDLDHIKVYEASANNFSGATEIAQVRGTSYSRPITGNPPQTRYYWLRAYNTSGVASVATHPAGATSGVSATTAYVNTAQIADQAISVAKFAASLTPVEIVGTLPTTGNFQGRSVFLTTDNKLYRYNGSAFVATVPTTDLTGTITNVQIADVAAVKVSGTLTDAQLAEISAAKITGQLTNAQLAEIAAAKVSGTLTDSQIAAISASKVTGTLTDAQLSSISAAKVSGTLTDAQIADISAAKISGTITNTQIADNAISTNKLAANAVTAGKIAADTITSNEIAANAITATELSAGSVVAGKIAADAVTANEIAANAVTATELAAGSVVAGKIAADAVTANEIAANSVTTTKLAANAVTAAKIAADTITSNEIAANAITATELAAGSVTAAKIVADTITSNEIAANTITAAEIAANTITANEIAANAITTDELAANAVTAAKIAANTITANEIAANAITTDELAANAVTAVKIAAGAITANEIAANTITAGQIASAAVTADELAAGAVTTTKLAVVSPMANLVRNGDFEEDLVEWTPTGTSVVETSTDSVSGSKRLAMTASPGGQSNVTGITAVPVEGGVDYELSCMAAASSASGTAFYLRVIWYNSAGAEVAQFDAVSNGGLSTTWTRKAATTTAPATARYARVQIWNFQPGGTVTFYVDAVSLRRVVGATLIQDGAISTNKIATDAVTAVKIAANAVTADKIVAGTITGDKINTGTALPGTITVGATGVSIGTVQTQAATGAGDPATRINAGSTRIDPGLILISGSTYLSSWRNGTDLTKIDGGNVAANTISANLIKVGGRGIEFSGLQFQYNPSNNKAWWTAGTISYTNDAGSGTTTQAISATTESSGFAQWTSGTLYIYWDRLSSPGVLQASTTRPTSSDVVIMATYNGGNIFNAIYGGIILDGTNIRAGSITATQLTTGQLISSSAQIADGVITNAKIGNLEVNSAKIANLTIGDTKMTGNAVTTLQTVNEEWGSNGSSISNSDGPIITVNIRANQTGLLLFCDISSGSVTGNGSTKIQRRLSGGTTWTTLLENTRTDFSEVKPAPIMDTPVGLYQFRWIREESGGNELADNTNARLTILEVAR